MRRHTRNLSLGLAAFIWSMAFGQAWATGSVRLEYVKANNVLSAETVSSSGASVQSSAAPDFGGVAGQVRINGLSGAVIVTVASANPIATQTNGYRIQTCSPTISLPIATGQKVAIIEAADPNGCPNGAAVVQADTFPFLNMSTAATTKIVTGVALKSTYITELDLMPGGTTNGTLVTGTGSNCGTGQAAISPAYIMTAQAGIVKGNGLGVVLKAGPGLDVCVINSQNVNLGVALAETQF